MFTWNYDNYRYWLDNNQPTVTNVEGLIIPGCNIREIKNLHKLKNLKYLNVSNNILTNLDFISNCHNIVKLYCDNNYIEDIGPVCNLKKLDTLSCSHNELSNIDIVSELAETLTIVNFSYNYISSFECLNDLTLMYVNISDNLLINTSDTQSTSITDVYSDSENVHNHHIQVCMTKSIQNILNENMKIIDLSIISDMIMNDTIITEQTKYLLSEYSKEPTVHAIFNINFATLLIHVFNRIIINPHSDEIKQILNIEMTDTIDKCFSGKFTRLINCLNGFDDLVNIEISESDQISNIIIQTKKQLSCNYSVCNHKKLAKDEMLKRGFDNNVIDSWIEHIA